MFNFCLANKASKAFVFSRRNLCWEMNESVIKANFAMFNSFF